MIVIVALAADSSAVLKSAIDNLGSSSSANNLSVPYFAATSALNAAPAPTVAPLAAEPAADEAPLEPLETESV